jgi:hypothetical protein
MISFVYGTEGGEIMLLQYLYFTFCIISAGGDPSHTLSCHFGGYVIAVPSSPHQQAHTHARPAYVLLRGALFSSHLA